MTSAQVVETSVKVTTNSPSQDYTHPDDHNLRTYDMTPGFKPFTIILAYYVNKAPSRFYPGGLVTGTGDRDIRSGSARVGMSAIGALNVNIKVSI